MLTLLDPPLPFVIDANLVGSGDFVYKDTAVPFSFELGYEEQQRIAPEKVRFEVSEDCLIKTTTAERVYYDKKLLIDYISRRVDYSLEVESSNESVCRPDGVLLRHKGYGASTITVNGGNQSRAINVSFPALAPESVTEQIVGGIVGSLREDACLSVEERLWGDKSLYTLQNHGASDYQRNSNCWLKRVDLTSISPWNSDFQHYKAGVLVSPRHILFAKHFPIASGSTIRFITNDNTVVTRTVASVLTHPNYNETSLYPDICVGVLNSDVPNTVGFVKVLPANYNNYLSRGGSRIPLISMDQEEKAVVSDLWILSSEGRFGTQPPENTKRLSYYESIIPGDSGNPCFMLIQNQLVLMGCITLVGGAGTFVTDHTATINTMMQSLGGGYSLTTIDLSKYRSDF